MKQNEIEVAEVMVQVKFLTFFKDIVCIPFVPGLRAEDRDEVTASCNLADRDD